MSNLPDTRDKILRDDRELSGLEEFFVLPPYSLSKQEKENLLNIRLVELSKHHYHCCSYYEKMLDAIGCDIKQLNTYYDIPFLPVTLFKELELRSIERDDLFKTMTSSGTTGQAVSKIYLDRTTARNQQKVMTKIVADYIGSSRLPMLILDSPSVLKNRLMFSARSAGILGFSIFGTDKVFALDSDMKLNFEVVEPFIEKYKDKPILLFGFTFMVWHNFYKALKKLEKKFDLSNGILIHGGGWKKLISEAVSKDEFKTCLNEVCGLKNIHDYYGMIEQTGCIYMECEYGHLHASNFSDIIMRRNDDFSVCDIGETGIVQVVSVLPESYPGHSLLTEDEGVILGEDDCLCGRKGKYFKIKGRLKNAEIRGCSDTYADKFR